MVYVLGSIEDEHCFSLYFILEKQNVQSFEPTLVLVVTMYAKKKITLDIFHIRLHIKCGHKFNQPMLKPICLNLEPFFCIFVPSFPLSFGGE
jgi:hypothetical protein